MMLFRLQVELPLTDMIRVVFSFLKENPLMGCCLAQWAEQAPHHCSRPWIKSRPCMSFPLLLPPLHFLSLLTVLSIEGKENI